MSETGTDPFCAIGDPQGNQGDFISLFIQVVHPLFSAITFSLLQEKELPYSKKVNRSGADDQKTLSSPQARIRSAELLYEQLDEEKPVKVMVLFLLVYLVPHSGDEWLSTNGCQKFLPEMSWAV